MRLCVQLDRYSGLYFETNRIIVCLLLTTLFFSSTLIDPHLNRHSDWSSKQFAYVVARRKLQLTTDLRHDSLLRRRLAEKLRIQDQPSVEFLPPSVHDDELVGNFLVQEVEHFLSNDFVRLLFLASICDHARRKQPSSWTRFCLQNAQNVFDSLPFKRREADDRRAVVFDSQLIMNSTTKSKRRGEEDSEPPRRSAFSALE